MSAGLASVVLATGALVAPARAAEPTSGSPKQAILGTSVLSVRRVPAWLQQTVADQRLASQLGADMAEPALMAPGAASCLAVSSGARQLFASAGSRELEPASNMKLLTATAALDKLGPDYRFTTSVEAQRRVAVGGVLNGNLYLVGGGDPLLRTGAYVATLNPAQPLYTSLGQLAAQVRASGIRWINGSVVGNEGRYDSLRSVAQWKSVYVSEGDAGPLSALDVDDGFPPPGVPSAPVATPPVEAAAALTLALQVHGVHVGGPPTAGAVGSGAVPVTSIHSAPLWKAIDQILNVSDNTGAELLTKELGRDFGPGGTTAAGTAVIRADLAAHGFNVRQLVNVDGSGLATEDRVTCGLVLSVLQRAGPSGLLAAGLPVAGMTGTLANRMKGTPAAGRVHAKTGTLDNVAALSGFVQPSAHGAGPGSGPLTFSLVLNGIMKNNGLAIGDRVAETLASYPAAPPAAAVDPRPPGRDW